MRVVRNDSDDGDGLDGTLVDGSAESLSGKTRVLGNHPKGLLSLLPRSGPLSFGPAKNLFRIYLEDEGLVGNLSWRWGKRRIRRKAIGKDRS
jgi:hypothetical protein